MSTDFSLNNAKIIFQMMKDVESHESLGIVLDL